MRKYCLEMKNISLFGLNKKYRDLTNVYLVFDKINSEKVKQFINESEINKVIMYFDLIARNNENMFFELSIDGLEDEVNPQKYVFINSVDLIDSTIESFKYKNIPDKALVWYYPNYFDLDVELLYPQIGIWDAENCTIFDGTGERNYPYFDENVELYVGELPNWYKEKIKTLK